MKEFSYNVLKLMECVREQPCIWDKSVEGYKDRLERRSTWEKIFATLEENYDEKSDEEKRQIGELIINKWTNLRDTFIKSTKCGPNRNKNKKKYTYFNHLKFLLKNLNIAALEDSRDEAPVHHDYVLECRRSMKVEDESSEEYSQSRKRSRNVHVKVIDNLDESDSSKEIMETPYNEVGFVGVDECNDPRVMNEDEAFFASLLPTVVKYDPEQKLEFRMEVLAAMKKILDKQKWTSN